LNLVEKRFENIREIIEIRIIHILTIFLTLTLQGNIIVSSGKLSFQLNENGSLERVTSKGVNIPVFSGKTLVKIKDINNGEKFYPLYGKVKKSEDRCIIEGEIQELDISGKITLTSRDDLLMVGIELKNHRECDRGLIVSLTIHTKGEELIWQGQLNSAISPEKGKYYGNNLIPISSLCSKSNEWGIASAIPPISPVFYDTHFKDGEFGLFYYVGITPVTREFPNKVKLSALFYPVNHKWGFRDALSQYYRSFPDFYKVRNKKVGMWVFRMNPMATPYPEDLVFYEAGGEEWEEVIPFKGAEYYENDKGYGWSSAWTVKEWAEKNSVLEAVGKGLQVFPYVIVGQRQIFLLPGSDLITDYNEAMELFEQWQIKPTIPFQNPENANSFRSVSELKSIIRNSGLYNEQGEYVIRPRLYTGNTLTFPLNPSPYLFSDTGEMTIAKYALNFYISRFLLELPIIAGIYMDSMGSWGNYLNYRREHFKYAHNPLSVDKEGKVVIPNVISHYEFLEILSNQLHDRDKLLFANGIHTAGADAERDGGLDYAAGLRNTSRFFLGALCDIAGSESGVGTARNRLEVQRVMMGPKPYASLSRMDEDLDNEGLERYFKRFAALGMFPGLRPNFYETDRFRPAIDKFHEIYLPALKEMHQRGWEPVTGVKGTRGLIIERFGNLEDGSVLLTMYNSEGKLKVLELQLDPEVFTKSIDKVYDIINKGENIHVKKMKISISIAPEELKVLKLE
jgi:hypothetical protein